MLKLIFKHEWLLLSRNPFLLAGLFTLMLSGIYSLYYGHSFLRRQQAVLTSIDTTQAGRQARHLALYAKIDTLSAWGKQDYMFSRDAYLSDYRMQKTVYNPVSPFAGLSIGQKDVFPYYYNLWILNNIYTSKLQEIRNPNSLLAGGFDLAFVTIYLFPLFIIAFGFNLLSSERDLHTFSLLSIHAPSMQTLIVHKLFFRFVVLAFCFLILSFLGFWLNGAQSRLLALGWMMTGLLYIGFWLGWAYAIAALNQTSSFNAIALISLWIIFVLFIPSSVNYYLQKKQGDAQSMRLISADRDGDNQIWNAPFGQVISEFHKKTPEFDNRKYPVKDSSNTRFVAYMELSQLQKNQIGKQEDKKVTDAYRDALSFNVVNPVFAAVTAFNRIAAAEVIDHIQFTDALIAYQQQRRHFIFKYELSGEPFGLQEYLKFPKFNFYPHELPFGQLLRINIPIIFWLFGLSLAAYLKTGKL